MNYWSIKDGAQESKPEVSPASLAGWDYISSPTPSTIKNYRFLFKVSIFSLHGSAKARVGTSLSSSYQATQNFTGRSRKNMIVYIPCAERSCSSLEEAYRTCCRSSDIVFFPMRHSDLSISWNRLFSRVLSNHQEHKWNLLRNIMIKCLT